MNNDELNNISQENDFEIIDLPNEETKSFNEFNLNQTAESSQNTFENQENLNNSYTEINSDQLNSNTIEHPNQRETENLNVYIPKQEVNDNEKSKKGLDKNIKELIAMGVIVAVVIILLPFMYNLAAGKYHVINNIKNLFESDKNSTIKTEEETTTENTQEETKNTTDSTTELNFDFSTYNNQILDNTALKNLLNEYKSNIISLNQTSINNIQTLKIEIAEDMTNVSSSVTNPDSEVETFNNQYLTSTLNYLLTIDNTNENIIIITAVQQ